MEQLLDHSLGNTNTITSFPPTHLLIETANSTDFVAHTMVVLLPINFVQSCAQSHFWIDHTWPWVGKIYKEQK